MREVITGDERFARLEFECSMLRKMDEQIEVSPQELNRDELCRRNWMDCSTPGRIQCFVSITGDFPPGGHTMTGIVNCKSDAVIPDLPIICSIPSSLHAGRRILQSPITFMGDASLWPQWYPFCTGVTVLKAFSDMETLTHIRFGGFGLRGDMVVYSFFRSCLGEERPYMESVQGSPPAEAQTFLGASIPAPTKGVKRLVKPFQRIRVYPESWQSMRIVVLNQDEVHNMRPINWITKRGWTFMSTKLGPMLQSRFRQFICNGEGMPPECEPRALRQQHFLERIHLQMQALFGPAPDGLGGSVLEQNAQPPSSSTSLPRQGANSDVCIGVDP